MKIYSGISQRESQNLPQGLSDFVIEGTDHRSVPVTDIRSSQANINNTSFDDQTKRFDINTKSKKKKA